MDRKLKVLLIDDSEEIQEIVRDALPEDEFDLHGERDTRGGLKEVLKFDPDIILLDYILPEISGMDALKEMKGHPLTKDTPVIVMSTSDNQTVVESFYQLGAIDYITKPVTPRILREKIRSLRENMHLLDRERPARGLILGFFGIKGGVGTTTLAVNTSLLLAQRVASEGKKVLLIDTDGFASALRFSFEIKDGASTIFNLTKEHPFDLDREYLLERLTKVSDNYFVLPSSDRLGQFEMITELDFSMILGVLGNQFDYIVVDMSRSFSDANLYVLENSNNLFLITDTSRRGLKNLHDTAATFRQLGIDLNKTYLLLNNYDRKDRVNEKELKGFVGIPCIAKIKSNSERYIDAEESGIPAAASSRSPVAAEFNDFVTTILSLTRSEEKEPVSC